MAENQQLIRMSLEKLPGILTLPLQDVESILARLGADERALFEETMEEISSQETSCMTTREWLHSTLSNVPAENWVKENGLCYLEAPRGASLKMLSRHDMTEKQQLQYQDRKNLCDELLLALSPQARTTWSPLLSWGDLNLADPAYKIHKDLRLYRTIIQLNVLFFRLYGVVEEQLNPSATEPLPNPLVRVAADSACQMLTAELTRECGALDESPVQWPVDMDDLVVRMLCNIAANRDLLESATVAQMSEIALAMNLPMVRALEQAGITETPHIRHEDQIPAALTAWFGPQGQLSGIEGFERALKGDDLLQVLTRAKEIRTAYLQRRGLNFPAPMIAALKGPDCLFCFALVVVAAFYDKARVPKEFMGEKNPRYALFPPPQGNARQSALPPHALEVYMASFGQFFFSMPSGWGISSSELQDYAAAMSHKRARNQEVIFNWIKRANPSQILKLHNGIDALLARHTK